MNCNKCRAVLAELARTGTLIDANQEKAALAHTATCQNCAVQAKRQTSLTEALTAWAAEPVLAPEAIWERLADHPLPKARRSRWPAAVASAVAVLVFSIAAATWKPARTPPIAMIPVRTPESPALVQQPEAQPVVTRARVFRKRRRHSAPGASAAAVPEITTSFFPLAPLADGEAPEGQLVRVKLPRPALVSFGLPMNPDEIDEPIKADVLLAADGTVRAIRFVQ